jgi:hypothetical protein
MPEAIADIAWGILLIIACAAFIEIVREYLDRP